jgi:hypothetical protein
MAVRALVLQPLDDAVGEDRGVAHQLFLAFGRRRHVGRQQEILAGDFKAVAGIEEERGVAGLDRLVERQQRLAERLPGLVLRHHHGEAELLERIAHGAGVVDRLLQLGHVLVVVVGTGDPPRSGAPRRSRHRPDRHRQDRCLRPADAHHAGKGPRPGRMPRTLILEPTRELAGPGQRELRQIRQESARSSTSRC